MHLKRTENSQEKRLKKRCLKMFKKKCGIEIWSRFSFSSQSPISCMKSAINLLGCICGCDGDGIATWCAGGIKTRMRKWIWVSDINNKNEKKKTRNSSS